MAYLIASGNHRFELGSDVMTLGTDPKADINITRGFEVAPSHVSLEPREEGHVLRPLSGSDYTTFVNGIRVELPAVLEHDDKIKVGTLQVHYENEAIAHRRPNQSQVPSTEIEAEAEIGAERVTRVLSKLDEATQAKTKREKFLVSRVLPAIAIVGSILTAWSEATVANRNAFRNAFPNATGQELRLMEGLHRIIKGPRVHRTLEEVIPQMNFSYVTPEEPWRNVPVDLFPNDTYALNEWPVRPQLAYVHAKTHQLFVISAAKSWDPDDYKSVLANQLRDLKASDSATVQKSYQEANIHGRRYTAVVYDSPGIEQRTHVWVHVGRRHLYRIIMVSKTKHASGMAAQGAALLKGFTLLF